VRLRWEGRPWWKPKRKWIKTADGRIFPTLQAWADAEEYADGQHMYWRLEHGHIGPWTYIDPPSTHPDGISRATLHCQGARQGVCNNKIHVLYDVVEHAVFDRLREVAAGAVMVKTEPVVLDQVALDDADTEVQRWHNKIVALEDDEDGSVVELVKRYKVKKLAAEATRDAILIKAGGTTRVPDRLDALLSLYAAMRAETDREKHTEMRGKIAERLADRWIEKVVLRKGLHRIDVYFKFRQRPEGPQDFFSVTFNDMAKTESPGAKADYVGAIEHGHYNPRTMKIRWTRGSPPSLIWSRRIRT
jgi:hypothetical protein